jgi:hypothetical protein
MEKDNLSTNALTPALSRRERENQTTESGC